VIQPSSPTSTSSAPAPSGANPWGSTLLGLAGLVLVLWLAALPFTTAGAEILLGTALALRLAAWALGGSALAPLLRGGPHTRFIPPLLLLFVLLWLVSALCGVDRAEGISKIPTLYRYLLFVLALTTPFSPRLWRWLLGSQALVAVVLLIQGALELHAGADRAGTPNLHYNTLAQVAGVISLLLLAAVAYGPWERARLRALTLTGSLVATVTLLFTLSRAAWIGWLSGGVLLALSRPRWRKILPAALVLLAIAMLVVPELRHRVESMADTQDPEFTRRYDLWAMAEHVIEDHPWTGIGPGGMDTVYDQYKTGVLEHDPRLWPHVHNDVLEVALSHGVPAALVWLGLIAALYAAGLRRLLTTGALPRGWDSARFTGAFVCLHLFTICGLLHDNYVIYVKINTWLFLLGLLVASDREMGEGRA